MVSVDGFMRRVPGSARPALPRSPAPTPKDTCGTEGTVSVSTIILRTDPSAGLPRAPALREVVDRFGMIVPAGFEFPLAFGRDSSLGSEL